jgi:hypothetical protein
MASRIDMAESLIVLLGVVLIAVSVYVVVRLVSRPPSPMQRAAGADAAGQRDVVLPVDDADPDDPATKRLVASVGHRVLAQDSGVVVVVVSSRHGRVLGRVERSQAPPRPFVDPPAVLSEPHAPRHAGPREPVASEPVGHVPAQGRFDDPRPQPYRPLAGHFELPARVTDRITNDEDPVEIVRAIIDASGTPIDVNGNIFRRGDRVLIVLHTPIHTGVDAETLNAAFLRFQSTGARRGVVLTAGTWHVHDVRRREVLAPSLLHAGPEAIQRMADAVAMGADPLDFVVLNV